tara:strand:+ start:5468 stop:5959 length:492 start_codon:yes stop_codon:yes gene_type:complete
MPKVTHDDMDLYVRPFEEGDVEVITPNLRLSDVIEVAAMMGPHKSTQEHLKLCVDDSKEAYCLVHESHLVALWGVTDSPHVDNYGIPWLVATEGIQSIGLNFAYHSREWIRHLSRGYEALYNFVHVPHWQSQKWLQLCGFNVITSMKYGFNGEDFYLFMKECA